MKDPLVRLGQGLDNLDGIAIQAMSNQMFRSKPTVAADQLILHATETRRFTKGHSMFELRATGRRSFAYSHPLEDDWADEDDLADEYKDYLVDLAGVASQDLARKVNETLESGHRDELTVNQTADRLSQILQGFRRGRLRTIVRTEGSRVAAKTRRDVALRAIEAGFGPSHLAFSAILDERVTDTCTFGHGHVMTTTGDDPWHDEDAPFHYNCRSLLTYRYPHEDLSGLTPWDEAEWEHFKTIQAREFPSWVNRGNL